MVQRWPHFNWEAKMIKKIPLWANNPYLPLYCVIKKFLTLYFVTVYVKETTFQVAKEKFARISVESDLSQPLTSKFVFESYAFKFEHKWLHEVCFGDGKYNHKKDIYPTVIQANPTGKE